ncbi:MAG TPA: hypothetical protein EYO79_05940 [Candidatus Marinimicrobia bacterium]|jgi:hypothetical protein|nr:hypothetical protein [Candidatus Neomarinimicrobiota bacterium]
MNKLKTIIIVGIISIGLVAVAVANNDVKTAEKNSEKVFCTHQASCSDQKKETCSYKDSVKNCNKVSDKSSCSKAELKQACSSKKNG